MAHPQERQFMELVKSQFPEKFKGVKVLDVGSLCINGSNRDLFDESDYTGIDVAAGKNVDVVCMAHDFKSDVLFDTIISSECFEHDCHFPRTIRNIVKLLKSGGLFVWTAGGLGRGEHGTEDMGLTCAPGLASNPDMNPNYYKNVVVRDLSLYIDLEVTFGNFTINYRGDFDAVYHDIQFWGIKR
jgi:SAM-dependent methyltransferase